MLSSYLGHQGQIFRVYLPCIKKSRVLCVFYYPGMSWVYILIMACGMPEPCNSGKIIITILVGALYHPYMIHCEPVFWQEPSYSKYLSTSTSICDKLFSFMAHLQIWKGALRWADVRKSFNNLYWTEVWYKLAQLLVIDDWWWLWWVCLHK